MDSYLAFRKRIRSSDHKLESTLRSDEKIPVSHMNNACWNADLDVVKILMNEYHVNPAASDNSAFNSVVSSPAVEANKLPVIELLLSDPRVDPASEKQTALLWAYKHNEKEVLTLLLDDPRIDPSHLDIDEVLSNIEESNALDLLMADPRFDKEMLIERVHQMKLKNQKEILETIAKHSIYMDYKSIIKPDDIVKVKKLVYDWSKADTALKHTILQQIDQVCNSVQNEMIPDNFFGLSLAAYHGDLSLFNALLKLGRHPRNYQLAFKWACSTGRIFIVKHYLNDPKFDLNTNRNYCIKSASLNGFDHVVKELLKDPRIDPSVDNNFALRYACKNGHERVAMVLINDPRVVESSGVDLAYENANKELKRKIFHDNTNVVSQKFYDPTAVYTEFEDYKLRMGIFHGTPETYEKLKSMTANQLLQFQQINEYPIKWAAARGHLEIVKLFLDLGNDLDFNIDHYFAIRFSFQNNHYEITKLLLSKTLDRGLFGDDSVASILDLDKLNDRILNLVMDNGLSFRQAFTQFLDFKENIIADTIYVKAAETVQRKSSRNLTLVRKKSTLKLKQSNKVFKLAQGEFYRSLFQSLLEKKPFEDFEQLQRLFLLACLYGTRNELKNLITFKLPNQSHAFIQNLKILATEYDSIFMDEGKIDVKRLGFYLIALNSELRKSFFKNEFVDISSMGNSFFLPAYYDTVKFLFESGLEYESSKKLIRFYRSLAEYVYLSLPSEADFEKIKNEYELLKIQTRYVKGCDTTQLPLAMDEAEDIHQRSTLPEKLKVNIRSLEGFFEEGNPRRLVIKNPSVEPPKKISPGLAAIKEGPESTTKTQLPQSTSHPKPVTNRNDFPSTIDKPSTVRNVNLKATSSFSVSQTATTAKSEISRETSQISCPNLVSYPEQTELFETTLLDSCCTAIIESTTSIFHSNDEATMVTSILESSTSIVVQNNLEHIVVPKIPIANNQPSTTSGSDVVYQKNSMSAGLVALIFVLILVSTTSSILISYKMRWACFKRRRRSTLFEKLNIQEIRKARKLHSRWGPFYVGSKFIKK